MTPRERTVVLAIAAALKLDPFAVKDMDAYATSYAVPPRYKAFPVNMRAGMLLQALVEES